MKEVIEKAIANGYKYPQTTIGHTGTWHETTPARLRSWIDGVSVYELIFGTDFIDKLVEPTKPKCLYLNGDMCEESPIHDLWHKCNPECEGQLRGWWSADRHRREMANIKDISDLKEYIKNMEV